MSNLLLEVDEAMRREHMEKLWKQYGNTVLSFIGLIILGTAIYSGWSTWDHGVRTAQTEQLMALLEDPKFPANIDAENLDLRAPLRGIALVNGAARYLQDGKGAEALALLKAAAEDSSIPRDTRQLAILMQARQLAADGNTSAADLHEMLKPVFRDTKSPWQPYALIEAASIKANQEHDYATARDYLRMVLENQHLPQSLYGKTQALDQLYATRQQQAAQSESKDQNKDQGT